MIKVYTSRAYVTPDANCVVMLMPFWGKGSEDPQEPEAGRFDRYIEKGQSFYELTALHDADLAVAPSGWEVPGMGG